MLSLLSKELSRVFSRTTVRKHPFFGAQTSLWSNSHIRIWLLEKPPLTIRTFVYLDESALSKYEFLLTSVWKLLMAFFFCEGDMCISLSPGTIRGEDLSGKEGPLVWTTPAPRPRLRPDSLPTAAFLSPGLFASGRQVSTGNPSSSSSLAGCPQGQFHPLRMYVNELSPLCFSKLKSKICCI